eukprot:13920949-Alexandrium_andersonii.AAC.1
MHAIASKLALLLRSQARVVICHCVRVAAVLARPPLREVDVAEGEELLLGEGVVEGRLRACWQDRPAAAAMVGILGAVAHKATTLSDKPAPVKEVFQLLPAVIGGHVQARRRRDGRGRAVLAFHREHALALGEEQAEVTLLRR